MGELVPFDAGAPPAVFANRKSTLLDAAKAGIEGGFAVLGYKGRAFSIKYQGESKVLKNADGSPLSAMEMVVIGVSPAISKQWYDKKYSEGDDASPDCLSVDGIRPDPSSPKRQCATCDTCPHNQWGSRVTEAGKKGKECQDSRRIAVVPLSDIENKSFGGPVLLRVPPMSLGNLANYASLLARKGAGLEFVGTKISFDWDVAYPRLTFEAMGWLSQDQAVQVVGPDGKGGMCVDPMISRMLEEAVVDEAPAAEPDVLDEGGPAPVLASRAATVVAQPAAEPVHAPTPVQAVQEPTPAVSAPAPAAVAGNPFGAAPFGAAPTARTPEPVAVTAPVAKKRAAPAPMPEEAPVSMEDAIDDLLNAPIA